MDKSRKQFIIGSLLLFALPELLFGIVENSAYQIFFRGETAALRPILPLPSGIFLIPDLIIQLVGLLFCVFGLLTWRTKIKNRVFYYAGLSGIIILLLITASVLFFFLAVSGSGLFTWS